MSKPHPKSFALFLEQITQSNNLHWYFGVAVTALIFYVYGGTQYFQTISLFLLMFLAATCVFTLAYHRIQKSFDYREENFKLLKSLAVGQIISDLVFIAIAIHFSGGRMSPFPLIYILYLGSISIFFSTTFLIILNAIAVILYAGLMQAYMFGILVPVIPATMQNILANDAFLRNTELIYVVAMIV